MGNAKIIPTDPAAIFLPYQSAWILDDVLPGLPGRPLAKASKRKTGGKRKGGVARLQEAFLAGGSRGALAVSLGRVAGPDREDAQ